MEICRSSSHLFLSSRPRTGLATTYLKKTYITGMVVVVVVVVVSHIQRIGCQPEKTTFC